jgi:hypothetical protein
MRRNSTERPTRRRREAAPLERDVIRRERNAIMARQRDWFGRSWP